MNSFHLGLSRIARRTVYIISSSVKSILEMFWSTLTLVQCSGGLRPKYVSIFFLTGFDVGFGESMKE